MKKTTIFVLLIFFACNSAVSGDDGGVEIHGFISQGYLQSSDYKYFLADTDDGTFEFNEMGINFSTDVTDTLRIGIQFMSRDLGSIGNDEIKIDWAYADYRYRNWLGLRVGKVKKPQGLFNQSRDIDAARSCILLPSSIYDEKLREAVLTAKGASVYGTLPGSIDYQLVYGVMTIPPGGGLEQAIEQSSSLKLNDTDTEPGFNGELIWNTPLDGLRIGYAYSDIKFILNIAESYVNAAMAAAMAAEMEAQQSLPPGSITIPPGYYPAPSEAPIEITSHMFSGEYTYGNFFIASEFFTTRMMETDNENYYVMINYRFTDWFELGFYYAAQYANKDDKDGKDAAATYQATLGQSGLQFEKEAYLIDFTLTTRFDINDSWIFKLEGHMLDGLSGVDYSASDSYDPDDPAYEPDPGWYLFAAKLSYSFQFFNIKLCQ